MRLAHQMAMYSDKVHAEMVDAGEFPVLSREHRVRGVPRTVINDGKGAVEGFVPEGRLVSSIRQAIG